MFFMLNSKTGMLYQKLRVIRCCIPVFYCQVVVSQYQMYPHFFVLSSWEWPAVVFYGFSTFASRFGAFGDVHLHTLVVTSGCLSYCCIYIYMVVKEPPPPLPRSAVQTFGTNIHPMFMSLKTHFFLPHSDVWLEHQQVILIMSKLIALGFKHKSIRDVEMHYLILRSTFWPLISLHCAIHNQQQIIRLL